MKTSINWSWKRTRSSDSGEGEWSLKLIFQCLYFTSYVCQDVPSPQLELAWLLQQEQVCHEAGRREEDCKMGEKRTEEGSTQINYAEIYHVF